MWTLFFVWVLSQPRARGNCSSGEDAAYPHPLKGVANTAEKETLQ